MRLSGGFGKAYRQQGVDKFYSQNGETYQNPHKYDIQRLLRTYLRQPNKWLKMQSKILDLACGTGQVTLPLVSYGYKNIKGTDPYTHEAYRRCTNGRHCDKYGFLQIMQGCYEQQKFDCIICSYAMHLVKQDMLYQFCRKLSEIAKWLIIISPHKLPIMKDSFGWKEDLHKVQNKIHFRVYHSYNYSQEDQGKTEEFENQEKKIEKNEENQINNSEKASNKQQTNQTQLKNQNQQQLKKQLKNNEM